MSIRKSEVGGGAAGMPPKVTVELLMKEIEAHQRDKAALAESERRYTTLVENTLTGIYLHDGERLVFCNERFARIFGFERAAMEQVKIDEMFATHHAVETLLSGIDKEEVVEGVRHDGGKLWLKVSRARLECEGRSMVLGNVIDISEQMLVSERLKSSERELHLLSARLIAAQETERKRIANELHDGLGQRLSAIKFAVENVYRSIDVEIEPEQARRLAQVVETIRDSIEEVRRVSMDLRPSILDDLGLIATIGWFCREFGLLFPHIDVHRNILATEEEIADEIKVVIFRIIQEAFHNITKHAAADRIDLDLLIHNSALRLMIRDNGRGIASPEISLHSPGLGLKSMRERAELTHGEFRVDSVAGRGTMISVRWPHTMN